MVKGLLLDRVDSQPRDIAIWHAESAALVPAHAAHARAAGQYAAAMGAGQAAQRALGFRAHEFRGGRGGVLVQEFGQFDGGRHRIL